MTSWQQADGRNEAAVFELRKFQTPDAVHAPAYFWFLNGELTAEELREQIRDMAAAGARTICPHPLPKEFRAALMSEMSPAYLSEEYLELFEVIADECDKLGLACYLYDEGGWPSGGACGQVYAADPEHFARCSLVFDGPDKYRVVREPAGRESAPPADVLQPGAVAKFLELTHEKYAAHIGKHFGKTIRFTFTDEPARLTTRGNALGWTADFAEVFQAEKGYDIRPYLYSILTWDQAPESIQPRIDYYDVMARLFVERYTLPLRDWCRRHGLLSGGHVGGEDYLASAETGYGKLLRTLRTLDMPGVDVIWRQLWPGRRLHSFPKFAASAAHQTGAGFVLGEMFCVYGQGLTFDQMRFLIDYFAVCGVNSFVLCSRPYATAGGRMVGERPHSGPVNPQWRHVRGFHDYTARLSFLAALGRPAVETALYFDDVSGAVHPYEGRYAEDLRERLAFQLGGRQVDFDYVDNDLLAAAAASGGKAVYGPAAYSVIVIPPGAPLTAAARANLERLRAAGVKILSPDALDAVPPVLALKKPDWRLLVRKRVLDDGNVLYFVFNTAGSPVTAEFQAAEPGPAAHCGCETGKLHAVGTDGAWQYTFAPCRTEVFLVGPAAAEAEPVPAAPGAVLADLSGCAWTLRPVIRHTAGEQDYVITRPQTPAVPVRLGDWSAVLGRDFSGEAVYAADFAFRPGMRFLDLGQVKYSAEVRVNGQTAGIRLYAPYVFDLQGLLRDGVNHLEVHVVNTLANAVLADGVQERWAKLPYEGSYDKIQRRFEQESLTSGLWGPVTVRRAAGREEQ